MTALAAPATLTGNKGIVTSTFGRPTKASKTFWGGALVCLDAGRFSVPAVSTAGGRCAGVVDLDDKESFVSSAVDGADNVKLRTGIFPFKIGATVDALLKADELSDVFVLDDQTVGKTDGGVGRPVAGQLWLVGDADGAPNATGAVAWVSVGGPRIEGGTRGARIPDTIAAAGAISVTTEWTLASVTGTTAYTLADGTRLGQRKLVTVVAGASTPAATITPATPSGFATVSALGAIGDLVEFEWTLVAGVAAWVIRAANGVTVA